MPPPAKIARESRTAASVKKIHAQMEALGKDAGKAWFEKEGGVRGLARKYGIKPTNLKNYVLKNGDLTADGKDIVKGASKEKVTKEKLLQCEHLLLAGEWPEDGVRGLAKKLNVKYDDLRKPLKNYFSAKGLSMPPPAKIARESPNTAAVKEIHAQMKALGEHGGKAWFQAEGGCKGLARKYGIKPKTLGRYFLENGDLSSNGNDVVYGDSKNPVTIDILRKCEQLRSEGKWPKGGVTEVAETFNVRSDLLKNYFKANGTLRKRLGERRLKAIKEGTSLEQRKAQRLAQQKGHSQVG
ncbi:Uncharacterised protein [Pandoraea pulmonicola]|uniref:Uncharacterized protein n=2 Tax=Pandoraea pulmonicola TaxID=93221 RepID=A0AAJ5D1X0_PANPU|nr:Uncharacterised protein [Pandoraea pulmonicola]